MANVVVSFHTLLSLATCKLMLVTLTWYVHNMYLIRYLIDLTYTKFFFFFFYFFSLLLLLCVFAFFIPLSLTLRKIVLPHWVFTFTCSFFMGGDAAQNLYFTVAVN
uniref:Uncharacterized protein n=1 Tax=Trypanosoma vivax (strain Y486) TaxID=1055687 RepID=G0TZH3_TRYVY|nr:hypothetical protein TVY486_0706860 [Trypanosoma vivax Y486]